MGAMEHDVPPYFDVWKEISRLLRRYNCTCDESVDCIVSQLNINNPSRDIGISSDNLRGIDVIQIIDLKLTK